MARTWSVKVSGLYVTTQTCIVVRRERQILDAHPSAFAMIHHRMTTTLSPMLRYASTKAKASADPLATMHLTPEKLRALISIYHSSANFITPQNLSAAIDDAFLDDPQKIDFDIPEKTAIQLQSEMKARGLRPETGRWGSQGWGANAPVWTTDTVREKQVRQALYGSEEAGKPGLEILLEERKRIMQQIKEDSE